MGPDPHCMEKTYKSKSGSILNKYGSAFYGEKWNFIKNQNENEKMEV